ncbi:glycosyl hydrolase [bacterium]
MKVKSKYAIMIVFIVVFFALNLYANINDNKITFIMGQDRESIKEYIKDVDIIPAGFMVYNSIQQMEGLDVSAKIGSCYQDFSFLVQNYPDAIIQMGLYMVGALDDVLEGYYDGNINKLITWVKEKNNPIYLRIGYEFDLPCNNYDFQSYKKAFRYIVDKFREQKVYNIEFVWHSFAARCTKNIEHWYPGDEYVDWCAISYFDNSQLFMKSMLKFAAKHNKPLMIAEAAPKGYRIKQDDDVWDKWFKPFFEFIYANDIKFVSYINTNWDKDPMWQGQNWGDSRVQTNHLVKQKWINEMLNGKFDHYYQYSFQDK